MPGAVSRAFLITLLFVASAAAQEVFRSQSNLVVVPALVRDSRGHPVYGLQAKDFIIEDDGVVQPSQLDEAAEAEPLSLLIAIQTGRSANREFSRIQGLRSMLQPILDQDGTRTAIVEFDSGIHLAQDFTEDESAVDKTLQHMDAGDGGAAILDAVQYSVNLLNKQPQGRQRVLLLVSETRDHGSFTTKLADVVKSISDGNTVVYTLVFSPALSNMLDTGRGTNQEDMHAGPDLLAPLVLAVRAMQKNAPKAIASMTGGEYELFATRKTFENRMNDFSNHIHSRYLLSFQPKDPHPGLHQLKVGLADPKNGEVLARGSYWAQGTSQ